MTADAIHTTDTFPGASGASIFYQKWLPSDGVRRGIVVIVHGLGEHSGRYRHLVERLLPEGYGLYGHDHQGFGRSGGRRGHVARFKDYLPDVQRVVELARQENPGRSLALFGHSMGGLIGLYYALEHPDSLDRLVISAPALRAEHSKFLAKLMEWMNKVWPTFSIRRPGDFNDLSRDPEEVRRAEEDPLWVYVSSARWVAEFLAAQSHIMDRAEEIRLPLLMLQGAADTAVIPAATEEFFARVSSPDKTLQLYEGYYHELHNDRGRERPLDDVARWLNARMDGR